MGVKDGEWGNGRLEEWDARAENQLGGSYSRCDIGVTQDGVIRRHSTPVRRDILLHCLGVSPITHLA
jgi:hypothetical protein